MFGFGKRAKIFDGKSKNEQVLAEMKSAVDQKKRVAPYEPFILTGHELAEIVSDCVAEEPEHALDTALVIVGSLAGYAAALSAADAFEDLGPEGLQSGDYEQSESVDGEPIFAGALIDEALISGKSSFWRMVDAKGRSLIGDDVPMLGDIKDHVDQTTRTDAFGLPRMPEGTRCLEKPRVLVEHLWPELLATLTARRDDPADWCMSWGFAAQELLEECRGQIACADAMRIMMECAIPMSRLNPNVELEERLAA